MFRFEKVSREQWAKDTQYSYDSIKLPKRGTAGSAGYDFFSVTDFVLAPGQTILLPTGIRMVVDADKFLLLLPRSGQGFKTKVQLYNTAGVIDSDYSHSKNGGHMFIKLYNDSPEGMSLVIKAGDAVCQGICLPYFVTDDDDCVADRDGGFGSTDK